MSEHNQKKKVKEKKKAPSERNGTGRLPEEGMTANTNLEAVLEREDTVKEGTLDADNTNKEGTDAVNSNIEGTDSVSKQCQKCVCFEC